MAGRGVRLNHLNYLHWKMTRMVGWMSLQKSCQHRWGNLPVLGLCSKACHCLVSAEHQAKVV